MQKIYRQIIIKSVVGLLVMLMLFEPLGSVLAQEISPVPTANESANATDSIKSDASSNDSVKQEAQAETAPAEEAPATAEDNKEEGKEESPAEEESTQEEATIPESIPEPPTDNTIKLPSTVKQSVPDSDILSGALVYNYPMFVPSGRGGLQPQIGLSYNSQNNEEGSQLGYGWSLGLPYIERKNIDGLQKLYTSDNFTSSLDGDLKKTSQANGVKGFAAKIDSGSFTKYEWQDYSNGGSWVVKSKDGLSYTFGSSQTARLSNPSDQTKVFRWHLSKIEDTKGNFVSYEYTVIDGQVYPTQIGFTNHAQQAGIYKYEFSLEDRSDQALSAKYGFMVKNTKRISKVELKVQDQVALRYSLRYQQNDVNNRTQLVGVKLEGVESSGQITSGGEMLLEYNSIGATGLLTKITNNTGGTTSVEYKSSAQLRDENGNLSNPDLPFPMQVVSKISYDDAHGTIWANEFSYSGGWYYYNGPMDRRFVGFEKAVRTDSAGNKLITFYHQGNSTNAGFGEGLDDWAKAGKVYRTELRDSGGLLITSMQNTWEFVRMAGSSSSQDRSFVKLSTSLVSSYDGNESHKDRATSYTYNNTTGNLSTIVDFGEVTASASSFSDIGTDKVTVNYTYATNPLLPHFTSGVKSIVAYNQNNQKVQETKNYYDGLPYGEMGAGNLTKQQKWIEGNSYAETSSTYNAFGLTLAQTDPMGHTTTYSYDSFGLYPASQTNALGHVTSFEYDYLVGKANKTIDSNGAVSKVSFDRLGRVTKEELTDPSQSNSLVLFTKNSYSYELVSSGGNGMKGWKTTQTKHLDAFDQTTPRMSATVTYTDGFDRVVQMKTQTEPADGSSSARFVASDTKYNNIGQILKTSLPYFSNSQDLTQATADAWLWSEFSYDAAYRVITITNSVGTSTNSYDNWKITSTDAGGKVKVLHKDAFDALVKVEEHNGSEVYNTRYDYDAVGNLTKITDALGNVRAFKYDGLGRRTESEDLHAPNDNTFGVWQFTYDFSGNLKRRLDPNGETLKFDYDALNRVAREFVVSGNLRTYTYDSCTNGIGRLCSTSSQDVLESYSYDKLGQRLGEAKTISGQNFTTSFGYDRQGNQYRVVNPDLSEVKYEYNLAGLQERVLRKEAGETNYSVVISDLDYAPTGSTTYTEYANGSKVTQNYDATKQYRLTNKTSSLPLTGGGIKTIQNLSYTYDAVGNIIQIVDQSELSTRKTTNYSYDDLHRLILARTSHAIGGNNYIQSYSYDAIGNILFKSDVGTYSYDGDEGESYANPHAVTKIIKDGVQTDYSYDRNGNMLLEGEVGSSESTGYEWDVYNRLKNVSLNGVIANVFSYLYDSNGIRVKVAGFSGATYYPSGTFNTDGTTAQKHILAGESSVATIKGSGGNAVLTQLFTDHLGSVVVTAVPDVNSLTGGVAETVDYYPFGEIRFDSVASGAAEQRKYIGKEYDVDTGLSYLDARYYNPNIARFISQDSVHLALGNPQAIKAITSQEQTLLLSDPQILNSYSYARNNPVRMKDPSGNIFKEAWSWGKEKYNQAVVSVGDWANEYAKKDPVFDYITTDPTVAYISGGIGATAGIGAAVLTGAGATGITTIGSTCVVACSTAAEKVNTFNPIAQQSQWLEGVTNVRAQNVVKDIFRAQDRIPGGTIEAIRREVTTGQLVGGKSHITKGWETINRINNILDSGKLNSTELQKLHEIRQQIETALTQKWK